MKKTALVCMLCAGAALLLTAEETPESIVRAARTQAAIKSIGTRAKMELQKSGATLIELVVDQYSLRDSQENQRTFLEIKAPASMKGTRFLMIVKDGTVDQRIYLPSLGKIRRIAGEADGTESFLGTDFSYNDLAYMERNSDLDTYTMLDDKDYNGMHCYVIEAKPKNTKSEYSKTHVWIEKDTKHFIKTEFFDKKGTLVKVIEMSNYETIQGISTPMITKMTTLATGTATVIHVVKMQYNMNIPDKVFTARYLEQGR